MHFSNDSEDLAMSMEMKWQNLFWPVVCTKEFTQDKKGDASESKHG